MSLMILRPKTNEANAILEQFGDTWKVAISTPDPLYGSQRKLMLEPRSDFRSKSMWVDDRYDELFEVIYM